MPMSRLQRNLFAPLALLLGLVACVVGVAGYEAFVRKQVLQERVEHVQRANELVVRLNVLQGDTQFELLRYVQRPDRTLAGHLDRLDRESEEAVAELGRQPMAPAGRLLFDQYAAAQRARREMRLQLGAAAAAGDAARIELTMLRWHMVRRRAQALLADVSAYQLNVLERTMHDLDRRRGTSLALLVTALALSLGTVLAYAWYVGRTVVAPIASLTSAAAGLPASAFEPPPDSIGRPDEIGLLARTLTRVTGEMRASNERLRQADRRKDEFLGMLSHELRNPLAPIRNSLFILDHPDASAEQHRRARDVALRQVNHPARIVDELLDVTRVARGRIVLQRSRLELCGLVRHAAEDYRAVLRERGLELAVEPTEGPLPVDGDETRLVQVLGNLLHNAAKFTPAGGRVTVSVQRDGAEGVVRVSDTGAGIDPDLRDSIFEAFAQGHQTLARSEGGLGLGLPLVKGLVGLHGGSVSVASDGPGCGSTFTVRLPLAEEPAPGTGASLRPPVFV
jgi:signal transduction histidine kinase